MTKAIFFDFDGVIMDSMTLKLDSYCHALDEFGFPRQELDRIMRQFMGTSRRRILAAMYEELAGSPMNDELFQRSLSRFNQHDEASRARMEPIPGSTEFLEKIHDNYFTAVVTGTPEEVIKRTTAFHKLDPFFDVVRGSPDSKTKIISELMHDRRLHTSECLFIGDGKADQEAADACQVRFVGMDNGAASFDPATAWRVVTDLTQLLPVP
jgi:phosphoglycolate phosphatase-like HAD superfamily hydrolase